MARVVLVTGARNIDSETAIRLCEELERQAPDIVIHGGAIGADSVADDWCRRKGAIAHAHYPDYQRDGWRAPLERNISMVVSLVDLGGTRVIAAPMPGSRGTWHCVTQALARGLTIIKVSEVRP